MSKIGRKSIKIPKNIKIDTRDRNIVKFEGPLGKADFYKNEEIGVNILKNEISLYRKKKSKNVNSLWGLHRALIKNIVEGITIGYKKKLIIKGVGYKVYLKKNFLLIKMGYSHDIVYYIPKEVKVKCVGNEIDVVSHDKRILGQVCHEIKNIRKIDVYKGKGIKLSNEKIILKQGKKK